MNDMLVEIKTDDTDKVAYLPFLSIGNKKNGISAM
jgi:hypothetical protein